MMRPRCGHREQAGYHHPMPTLSPTQLAELDAVARGLAARGGEILLDRFQSVLHVQYKDDNAHDPVTDVDRAIEDMVRGEVGERFPEHGVVGEEREDAGPEQADVVWVIDPLDGTSNFINGLGMFACSIGVLERGAPVAGAIFLPTNRYMRPGVYHAHRGSGLHFDGAPVDASPPPLAAASRLSTVPSGTGGITGPAGRRFGVARTLGSCAVELTLAAEGSVQMSLFDGAKVWDVAGGVALCLEAGRAIFTRTARGPDWRRFTRFGQDLPGPVTNQALRGWSDSLVVGDPALLPEAASDLRRAQGMRATVRRAAARRVRRTLRR